MYNLNVIKEVKVTEDYLKLDIEERQCQTYEPLENCTTKFYMKKIMDQCGCIPWSLANEHSTTVHKF